MRMKYLGIIAAVCIVSALGATGLAAYRLWAHSADMKATAEKEFQELVSKAGAAAALGFMNETFIDAVRESLSASDALAAVVVGGPNGPAYGLGKEAGRVDATETGPRLVFSLDVAQESLFAPIAAGGVRNAALSASYLAFDGTKSVEILRDSLFIVLAAIALGILALAFSLSASSDAETAGDSPRPREERKAGRGSAPGSSVEEEYGIPELSMDGSSPAGLFSPRSGLGWEQYTADRLASELHRCASFEQDLSFLAAGPRSGGDDWETSFAALSQAAAEHFTFRDLAFEKGPDGFSVILPNVDLDRALRLSEDFARKLEARNDALGEAVRARGIRVGISARAGRLVDAGRMLMEAERALAKARESEDTTVIAFRPDPERFRSFIAKRA